MADIKTNCVLGEKLPRLFKDMGDETFAEVVVLSTTDPVTLSGDIVVDTFGALADAKVTDPDAASATIPALLRGILSELKAHTTLLTTIAANTTLP